jgi:hypothetical protein
LPESDLKRQTNPGEARGVDWRDETSGIDCRQMVVQGGLGGTRLKWLRAIAKEDAENFEMVTSRGISESEQIRNLHEDLATVVDISITKPVQVAVCIERKARIEILQIAVVTKIDRRAGVEQIGEEDIGVEILGGLQGSEILIGKRGRILANEAEREFPRELVIPLGTNDVIVKDARTIGHTAETRQEIGVVDGELARGPERQRDLGVARFRKKRRHRGRGKRGVEVGVSAPAHFSIRGNTLGKSVLKEKSVVMMRVVAIVRQRAEIDWAKQFVSHIAKNTEENLALK